jgi:hypothetical protein
MGITRAETERTKNYKGIEQNAIKEIRRTYSSGIGVKPSPQGQQSGILTLL